MGNLADCGRRRAMIKVYDGEVFSFDIGEYDRSRILNQCWLNSNCSELKFLVYDGEALIGAMSYQDILADKPIEPNCLNFGEDLFAWAREYFRKEGNRQSCLPVQSRGGGTYVPSCVCRKQDF